MSGTRVELELGDRPISLETGVIARQADGAVVVRSGQAVVLATVVMGSAPSAGDSLALIVEYREKQAAAGRVPGSFLRREGRISDHEVLASRMIDRTLRPLFPRGFSREVLVQVTVLSADPSIDLPSLGLVGCGAAVHCSRLPFEGPVAGLRLVRRGGDWRWLPGRAGRRDAELDLVVATGRAGLIMVEGGAREVTEAGLLDAFGAASDRLAAALDGMDALRAQAGADKAALEGERCRDLPAGTDDWLRERLGPVLEQREKAARREAAQALARSATQALECADEEQSRGVQARMWSLVEAAFRDRILAGGPRPDGRSPKDVRPIACSTGWLPSTHGSAVFTRGQTQAVVSCTVAPPRSEQMVETLDGPERRRLLLHYNFPPYSVGEVRPLRGPGRREIGHGVLALRALEPVVPDGDAFPHVIRIESDITESNGSSSMATVCGASLALMDAGVPVGAAVAGIAMGLVKGDDGRHVVLTDILGDEDHLGDMDFKIAGTARGITAIQMDNKLGALDRSLLEEALEHARVARTHVLECMAAELDAPREEAGGGGPGACTLRIDPGCIGLLIGPKGASIKAIQEDLGVHVEVAPDGLVTITGGDEEAARRAVARVMDRAGTVESGRLYRGRVTGVHGFGAFVRIYESAEGLVPREEWGLSTDGSFEDLVEHGEDVVVRVLGVDDRGRIRLSRRAALGAPADQVVNASVGG